jgi:hypothetical protein
MVRGQELFCSARKDLYGSREGGKGKVRFTADFTPLRIELVRAPALAIVLLLGIAALGYTSRGD